MDGGGVGHTGCRARGLHNTYNRMFREGTTVGKGGIRMVWGGTCVVKQGDNEIKRAIPV